MQQAANVLEEAVSTAVGSAFSRTTGVCSLIVGHVVISLIMSTPYDESTMCCVANAVLPAGYICFNGNVASCNIVFNMLIPWKQHCR